MTWLSARVLMLGIFLWLGQDKKTKDTTQNSSLFSTRMNIKKPPRILWIWLLMLTILPKTAETADGTCAVAENERKECLVFEAVTPENCKRSGCCFDPKSFTPCFQRTGPCPVDMFECKTPLSCLERSKFCDERSDCRDGSDEISFFLLNPYERRGGKRCKVMTSKTCLLRASEAHKAQFLCTRYVGCSMQEYECERSLKCLSPSAFCDGNNDCRTKNYPHDYSDEIQFEFGVSEQKRKGIACRGINGKTCILPQHQEHKFDSVCPNHGVCGKNEFTCAKSLKCLPRSAWCDGNNDCRNRHAPNDFSDEFVGPLIYPDKWITCTGDRGKTCWMHSYGAEYFGRFICAEYDTSCTNETFLCRINGYCILPHFFCDGRLDCRIFDQSGEIDLSDELDYKPSVHTKSDGIPCHRSDGRICLLPSNQEHLRDVLCTNGPLCSNEAYLCENEERCIESDLFCNGENDCSDGSDEILYDDEDPYNLRPKGGLCRRCFLRHSEEHKYSSLCKKRESVCVTGTFECGQTCLPHSAFCDGKVDCGSGLDEIAYDPSSYKQNQGVICRSKHGRTCILHITQEEKKEFFCQPHDGCEDTEYECSSEDQCIPLDNFCDGIKNCKDGSDEDILDTALYHGGIPCKGKWGNICWLRSQYVHDGIPHCSDMSDECFYDNRTLHGEGFKDYTRHQCFPCLDGRLVAPLPNVCNGIFDCYDFSDECLCLIKGQASNDTVRQICENVFTGNLKSATCLSKDKICDGRVDCNDAEDEKYCKNDADLCSVPDASENWRENFCNYACYDPNDSTVKYGRTCDGRATCSHDIKYEECFMCNPQMDFCELLTSNDLLCGLKVAKPYDMCDGEPHCPDQEDERYCPGRFKCKSYEKEIPEKMKCDHIPDCADESDEMDCTDKCEANSLDSCKVSHFYCRDGKDPKYIKPEKVCDGNQDCATGVDECQGCTDKVFSDDESMISSKALPFLWIISIFAVTGNVLIIIYTIHYIVKKRRERIKKMTNKELTQNILVLNLSVSDLLVGVYTLAIGIMNVDLSNGRYCLHDQQWRSGILCSTLGVILMTGTEASVFTLTVMTAMRVKATLKPFAHTALRWIPVIIFVCWLAAIALAVIPLLPFAEDYFVERIWYKQNAFFTFVEKEQIERQTKIMIPLLNSSTSPLNSTFHQDIGKKYSWSLMEALISKIDPAYKVSRRFGYYSTHGVCLPRLFLSMQDTSWGYSLFILILNFLLFLFIAGGYILIYKRVTISKVQGTGAYDRNTALQRRVARIIITDMACWVPICIMGFINLSGINISTDIYVVAGMIFLPLNSAINPFLYSDGPEYVGGIIRKGFRWIQSRISSGRQDVNGINHGREGKRQQNNVERMKPRNHGNEKKEQSQDEITELSLTNSRNQCQEVVVDIDVENQGTNEQGQQHQVEMDYAAEIQKQEHEDVGEKNRDTQEQQHEVTEVEDVIQESEEIQQDQEDMEEMKQLNMEDAKHSSEEIQEQEVLGKEEIYHRQALQQLQLQPENMGIDDLNQGNMEQHLVEMDELNHGNTIEHQKPGVGMNDMNHVTKERQHEVIEIDDVIKENENEEIQQRDEDIEEMKLGIAKQQQDSLKMNDAEQSGEVLQEQEVLEEEEIPQREDTQQQLPERLVIDDLNQGYVEEDLVEMDEANHGIADEHHQSGVGNNDVDRGTQEQQNEVKEDDMDQKIPHQQGKTELPDFLRK